MVDPNPGRGMPLQLQRYWLAGKGAAKIRWNVPGDFMRCVHQLEKYFPKDPKGLCNILHTKATGGPPGHGSLEPKKHFSVDTAESLVAAANLLAAQPALGSQLWAGPLAAVGRPTGEPTMERIFDPGALKHRTLPLPLNHRRVTGPGHMGSVTVGRILGIFYGPDENGNEYCWGWGDWLDPEIVPEAKEAKYLVDQGVAGASVDPGGRVHGMVNPDTGGNHVMDYTIGGATLVSIPAFADMRLVNSGDDGDFDMGEDMPAGMYDFDLDADPQSEDCGCGAVVASVNPPGWRGLPLATREAVFDNDDAIKRIAAWAGIGTDKPDITRMKRAFMWHDSRMPETDPTAYRLPVGDIINGKLTLMYHAIYAAAALISGAHGGLPSISHEEKNQLRGQITEIYQAMAQDFGDSSIKAPWDRPMDDNQGASFAMADNPNQPYGDVAYADPGYQDDKKKRYPIDTAEHVRAAWSYINQKGNSGKYSPEHLKAIKQKIVTAAKKLGVDITEAPSEYSIPLEPPGWWFDDPMLPGKTPLTVDPDGRVYGHLAAWNECHRDVTARECVLAPHSKLNYRPFHLGTVRTAEGKTIQVGKIVQDTRHAGINLGYMSAAIHYDNTGDDAAVIRAGEDQYGIWVAGAMVPEATPRKVAKLRRSPLSGDWRRVEGNLELTAALAVNVPAFPVYAMEATEQTALVAAGTLYPEDFEEHYDMTTEEELDEKLDALFASISATLKEDEEDEVDEDEEDEEDGHTDRLNWFSDIVSDEKIYLQRRRAAEFAALLAAAEAPPVTGAPAPAVPGVVDPAAAGLTPDQQAAQAGEPTHDQQMLARQMNASYSVLQLPDGTSPSSSAPGTTKPGAAPVKAAPQAAAPTPTTAPAPPAQPPAPPVPAQE